MFQIQGSQNSLNNFTQAKQNNPVNVAENFQQAGNRPNSQQYIPSQIPGNNQIKETKPRNENILNNKFYGTGSVLDVFA